MYSKLGNGIVHHHNDDDDDDHGQEMAIQVKSVCEAKPPEHKDNDEREPPPSLPVQTLEFLRLHYQDRPRLAICCQRLTYTVGGSQSVVGGAESFMGSAVNDGGVGTTIQHVLQQISFEALPGTITAVMGPIGCGKTTLLKCLSGEIPFNRLESDSVVVYEHGDTIGKSAKWWQQTGSGGNLLVHIGQAEHHAFMSNFTVFETLMHAGHLCLPHFASDQLRRWVEDLMELLDLKNVRDTKAGEERGKNRNRLSGGQRRLLAVGEGLIGFPSILLLDEPMSGLDVEAARSLMQVLKGIAGLGCTIILNIHQPPAAVFQQCDKLLLLGQGGRQIYSGPREAALHVFEQRYGCQCPANTNVAEFLFRFIKRSTTTGGEQITSVGGGEVTLTDFKYNANRRVDIRDLSSNSTASSAGSGGSGVSGGSGGSGGWKRQVARQMWTLMKRDILNQWRDPWLFLVRLLTFSIFSVFACLLYGNVLVNTEDPHQFEKSVAYRIPYHNLVSCAFLSFSIIRQLHVQDEHAVVRQEIVNGRYGILPYSLTLWFSTLPFLILICFVCSALQYGLVDLWLGWSNFFLYNLAYILAIYTIEAMLDCISVIWADSPNVAVMLGIGFVFLGLTIVGFPIATSDMPYLLQSLHWASFQTHLLGAVLTNDLSSRSLVYTINGTSVHQPLGMNTLVQLGFNHVSTSEYVFILGVFGIAFRFVALIGRTLRIRCCLF